MATAAVTRLLGGPPRPQGRQQMGVLAPQSAKLWGRQRCPRVRADPTRAMFGGKKDEPGKIKPPSGLQVLLQKAFDGGKKASSNSDGFTDLMQSLGDGIVERNFGTGGSWPDAAVAKRKGECPRCGASTVEALAAAEAAGSRSAPGDDPVELAAAGQHPLGWCKDCATKNRLLDVSKSF